jgi:quinol monooxygenase YgiN
MSEQIQLIARFTVAKDDAKAFQAVVAEASAVVEANEPAMLAYKWYVSREETHYTLFEQYQDNEFILFHRDNASAQRGKFQALSSVRVEVFGDVGQEAHDVYVQNKAEFFKFFAGFSRYRKD